MEDPPVVEVDPEVEGEETMMDPVLEEVQVLVVGEAFHEEEEVVEDEGEETTGIEEVEEA